MKAFVALPLVYLLFFNPAHAESTEITVPVVIKDSSPVESMNADPVMPAETHEIRQDSSGGNVLRNLSDDLAVPGFQFYGEPGTAAQLRGLGRSATETEVEALGISLNPAQGGGFDFSIFPQYLWSDYSFELGPSLSGIEPRGVSGRVTLMPWTQKALASKESGFRLTEFYSSDGIEQLSIGGKLSDRVAALIGFEDGKAKGPTGSLSARWDLGPVYGQAHLLATRIEAETPGTVSAPTPNAKQITSRVIPVLQANVDPTPDSTAKLSAYYDQTYLQFDDPDVYLIHSRDHVKSGGADLLFTSGVFRLGGDFRETTLTQIDTGTHREDFGNVLGGATLTAKPFVLDAQAQATALTYYGTLPQGSLGLRFEATPELAVFSRVSFSNRYPTLLDRYYVDSAYAANPNLKVERDWTARLGVEYRSRLTRASLEGYSQIKKDAQVTGKNFSPVNVDEATVLGLLYQVEFEPATYVGLRYSGALAHSREKDRDLPLPYMAGLTQLMAAEVHDRPEKPKWAGEVLFRYSSGAAITSEADRIPPYSSLDLGARARVIEATAGTFGLELGAKLENVFGREIQYVKDFPPLGRALSLFATGNF